MKEKSRFTLSLYLDDPDQRVTAELLKAIPSGQRTAYICRAVRWLHDQEQLMDAMRSMLREELSNMEFLFTKQITATLANNTGPGLLGIMAFVDP